MTDLFGSLPVAARPSAPTAPAAAPASGNAYIFRGKADEAEREATLARERKATSETAALSRLADCVRDARGLDLAGDWTCGDPGDGFPTLTLRLRDPATARRLKAMLFGGE